MDFFRAIWTGALSWILVFFEVSILMFGFGIQNTDRSVFHHILFLVAIAIPSFLYFRKVKGNFIEGIFLWIIYFIVSLILDSIITIPLFVKDYMFLLNPYHLIGLFSSLIVIIFLSNFIKKA